MPGPCILCRGVCREMWTGLGNGLIDSQQGAEAIQGV